ncbi:hypothetical protein Hanom_Chr13g01205621 [Helianthus anomalus]
MSIKPIPIFTNNHPHTNKPQAPYSSIPFPSRLGPATQRTSPSKTHFTHTYTSTHTPLGSLPPLRFRNPATTRGSRRLSAINTVGIYPPPSVKKMTTEWWSAETRQREACRERESDGSRWRTTALPSAAAAVVAAVLRFLLSWFRFTLGSDWLGFGSRGSAGSVSGQILVWILLRFKTWVVKEVVMLLFGLGQVSGQFGFFRPTKLWVRFSQSQQLGQRVKAVNGRFGFATRSNRVNSVKQLDISTRRLGKN